MARANPTRLRQYRPAAIHYNEPETVSELCDRYEHWAEHTFRHDDGSPTGRHRNIRCALRSLRDVAGPLPPRDVTSMTIENMQQQLADLGEVCRQTINERTSVVKALFRWAAKRRYVPAGVADEVALADNLRRGRMGARESDRVKPVAWETVEQTLPHVARIVRAMVIVQWETGMRAGELVRMKAEDMNLRGDVWRYFPERHKTMHHGNARTVLIGRKAQVELRSFIESRPANVYLFSPAEARAEFVRKQHATRTTPLSCGNRPGTNRRTTPKRTPGARFTTLSYGRHIRRACDLAFPAPPPLARQTLDDGSLESEAARTRRLTEAQRRELREWQRSHCWHSHQIRHSFATRMVSQVGTSAAMVLLGHTTIRMTERYAEPDMNAAIDAVRRFG